MKPADLVSLAEGAFARLSPAGRSIRLRFPDRIGRVFDGVLLAQKVEIAEAVSEGLTLRVSGLAARADLPLSALVGLPIELQLVTDTGTLKRFCAVVTEVRQGESDGGLTVLRLTARDVLGLMEGRQSQRVFLDMSLPEVVRTVLDGWRRRFPALAKCFDYLLLDLQEDRYPKRAFLLQANQSDAAFLRSLLARDGVSWFVRPGPDGPDGTPAHGLVLFDDARSLPENAAGPVRYHRRDGTEPRDTVSVLSPAHRLVGGGVQLASWDHESGRVDLAAERGGIDQGEAGNEWAQALQQSRIVLPHAGNDADDFQRLARIDLEREIGRSARLFGIGGVRAQAVGEYNRIDGHPSLDAQPSAREYITLRLEHWAVNNLPKDLDERAEALVDVSAGRFEGWPATRSPDEPDRGVLRGQRYVNRFVAVRRDMPLRPPWNPADDLPPMHLMTATVVSALGQPVWTDGLMRVKVRLHGLDPAEHDHAAGAGTNGNAGDSAWVRVHMPWAGDGYGMLFVPREGMEASIAFEHGDPSRPVVVACRYNARQSPARFDHLGPLPDNHALSGIVTRELGGGGRQQQLRFDDTPGRISAQLASDHAASQLNLGCLATPMRAGQASARGEGAELRSNAATAVRGGQGVLISAQAQDRPQDHQLARHELLGLTHALEGVAAQMAELASAHGAGTDGARRLAQLLARLRDWEKGSSTDPEGVGGGAPIVAVSAEAGAAVTSQDQLLLGARTTLDAVSINDLHATAGQQLLLRSGALMSAFAQAAMKLVARLDVSIESHTGDVRIAAAKVIDLVAGVKVRIQAPVVEIVSEGAATRWGGGAIVEQAKGPFVVKAASFAQSAGGDGVPQGVAFAGTELRFDQQVKLLSTGTDEPLVRRRYVIKTASGATFRGTTDEQGLTQRFTLQEPYEAYTLEFPDDSVTG